MWIFTFVLLVWISCFKICFGVNVVCYFVGANGNKIAPPEKLNSNLCTHINYAFAQIWKNGTISFSNNFIDSDCKMCERVVRLKEKTPNLRVLLSAVGVSNSTFQTVAASEEYRYTFAVSAKELLDRYNLDGIDIDWEVPALKDKKNFIKLLAKIKEVFNGTSYLLTAAVFSKPSSGYDIPKMNKYLDFYNLMSYDYFGAWGKRTGQNSPLFQSSIDSNYEKNLNVAASASNWLNAGVDASKMNIGIAFYGRQFQLANASNHGLHDAIKGAGLMVASSYSYICQNYKNWTRVWDEEQKNPYKYQEDQWLGYDDEQSVRLKVQYALKQSFAGVMIWQIGHDDIFGNCGEPQGLLRAINNEIRYKVYRNSQIIN